MRPVTQVADVDVKMQSKKFVNSPALLEIGKQRSNAPTKIMEAKPHIIILVGEKNFNCIFFLNVEESGAIKNTFRKI